MAAMPAAALSLPSASPAERITVNDEERQRQGFELQTTYRFLPGPDGQIQKQKADVLQAEQILAEGKADVIGLCRALLCDPDWPIKAKEGRDKEIVKCAACNWCLEADSRYEQVKCVRYPENCTSAPEPFLPNMARPAAISAE